MRLTQLGTNYIFLFKLIQVFRAKLDTVVVWLKWASTPEHDGVIEGDQHLLARRGSGWDIPRQSLGFLNRAHC